MSTIESTHGKILAKIQAGRDSLTVLQTSFDAIYEIADAAGLIISAALDQPTAVMSVAPAAAASKTATTRKVYRTTAAAQRAIQHSIVQQRAAMRTGNFDTLSDVGAVAEFLAGDITPHTAKKVGRVGVKKVKKQFRQPPNFLYGIARDELEGVAAKYNLDITVCLLSYYIDAANEAKYTGEYYRIITSRGYLSAIDDALSKILYMFGELLSYCGDLAKKLSAAAAAAINNDTAAASAMAVATIINNEDINNTTAAAAAAAVASPYEQVIAIANTLTNASAAANNAYSAEVEKLLEQVDYSACSCGSRMDVVPALSQLVCPSCGFIDDIIGVAFSDAQLYTQEKTKHSGYDVNRHYRFWIDRIQALETKTFSPVDESRIEYVLDRDGIRRSTLNIRTMRAVLKELKLSSLNEHAALLIVQHDGPAPPRLSFQESMRLAMLFNKVMDLYDTAVQRAGNRPYYPYFIYKLIEQEFEGSDKIRLLDYIHLQSADTMIKNDGIYERICELAAEEAAKDGTKPLLRYRATERRY